jgi:hypothetical protein
MKQILRLVTLRVKVLNSLDGSQTTRAIPNPGSLQRNRTSVATGKPFPPDGIKIWHLFLARTLSLLRIMHSRRKATSPTIRTIYLLNHFPQHFRELISSEISALKSTVHPNICNIIDFEGSDIHAIRLTLEPIIGMSLSDILRRSFPTKEQMSCLLSMVGSVMCPLHKEFTQWQHRSSMACDISMIWTSYMAI